MASRLTSRRGAGCPRRRTSTACTDCNRLVSYAAKREQIRNRKETYRFSVPARPMWKNDRRRSMTSNASHRRQKIMVAKVAERARNTRREPGSLSMLLFELVPRSPLPVGPNHPESVHSLDARIEPRVELTEPVDDDRKDTDVDRGTDEAVNEQVAKDLGAEDSHFQLQLTAASVSCPACRYHRHRLYSRCEVCAASSRRHGRARVSFLYPGIKSSSMRTHHVRVGLLRTETHGRERTRAHDDPKNLDGGERDYCRGDKVSVRNAGGLIAEEVQLLTDREAILVLESKTDEKDKRLHDVSYGNNADQWTDRMAVYLFAAARLTGQEMQNEFPIGR